MGGGGGGCYLLDSPRSRGGDLFTDFDAQAHGCYGAQAHRGVLSAAKTLERELRPTLRRLVKAGGFCKDSEVFVGFPRVFAKFVEYPRGFVKVF